MSLQPIADLVEPGVCAAIVELGARRDSLGDLLAAALKRFLNDQNPKLADQFFAVTGPVGDFGAKIDLALLVRFVDEAVHRDLTTIKDIRNAFAHKLDVSNFSATSPKALSQNLQIAALKLILIGTRLTTLWECASACQIERRF